MEAIGGYADEVGFDASAGAGLGAPDPVATLGVPKLNAPVLDAAAPNENAAAGAGASDMLKGRVDGTLVAMGGYADEAAFAAANGVGAVLK